MLSIPIPKDVELISGNNFIYIKGPLGILIKDKKEVDIIVKEFRVYCISRSNLTLSSTFLALIKGLIFGVSKGYRRKLRLIGVGFKAFIKEGYIFFKIGYSHESKYLIPKDITITCSKVKGIIILVKGLERSKVNQVAIEIKRFRIPDIYKGKGIRYNKEVIKLKKGKKEGK